MCPVERNALKMFYDSTKGSEWTDNEKWLSEYTDHCNWYGIECNTEGDVTHINLSNNGLLGKLTTDISSLPYLEVLDVSDNN